MVFDIFEAYCVLAHDWGLYTLNHLLYTADFHPAPGLNVETLGENSLSYYEFWNSIFESKPPGESVEEMEEVIGEALRLWHE